tara:strand:+ start:7009 stop:9315 length:2307 start_codon:yes stop_codon:yes gene_type:complete
MDIIKKSPFKFDKLFCVASDCDMMTIDFLNNFINNINIKYGLPISNSFWVRGHKNSISILDDDDDVKNKLLIISHYHNGYLDHLHGWNSDSERLSIFDKEALNINNNKITFKNLDKKTTSYKFFRKENKNNPNSKIDLLKKDNNVKLTQLNNTDYIIKLDKFTNFDNKYVNTKVINFYIGLNCNINSIVLNYGNSKNRIINYDNMELQKNTFICGNYKIISLITEKLNYKTNKINNIELKTNKLDLHLITLGIINKEIQKTQEKLLDYYNIKPIYMSAHGGWTHNNRVHQSEMYSRSDQHTIYDYKPIKYITSISNILEDDCINMYYTFNKKFFNYNTSACCSLPLKPKFDKLIKQFNIKNITSGGGNIPFLINESLNTSDDDFWYTHLGTLNADINRDFYPNEYLEYFKQLSHNYYSIKQGSNRLFICSPSFYVKYKTIQQEIEKNIKIIDNNIYIDSWLSNKRNYLWLNKEVWSSDLAYITIYTPSDSSKLFINSVEQTNYIRNPKDNSGKDSITIVDITTPVILLSNLPTYHNGYNNINLSNQNNFNNDKIISVYENSNNISYIKLIIDNQISYNTSHLYINFETYFKNNSDFNIILDIDGKKIAIVNNSIIDNNIDSYWIINNKNCKMEYYLPVYDLVFINNELVLPNGKIKEVIIMIKQGTKDDFIHIKELSLLRSNPCYDNEENYLISGIVTKNNIQITDALLELCTKDNKVLISNINSSGFYHFKLEKNIIYKIKCSYKNEFYETKWRKNSKNEVNLNIEL